MDGRPVQHDGELSGGLRFILQQQAERLDRIAEAQQQTTAVLPSLQRTLEESNSMLRQYDRSLTVLQGRLDSAEEKIEALEELVRKEGPDGSLVARVRDQHRRISSLETTEAARAADQAEVMKGMRSQWWTLIIGIVIAVLTAWLGSIWK